MEEADDSPFADQCAICLLERSRDTCLLEKCLHGFCRQCILEWAEIGGLVCPLCKRRSARILYDVKSPANYKVLELDQKKGKKERWWTGAHHFRRDVYLQQIPGRLPRAFPQPYYTKGPSFFGGSSWEARLMRERAKEWVTRELQSLLEEEDVSLVCIVVCSLLTRHELGSGAVYRELSGLLHEHTQHFLHELQLFISTSCSAELYDSTVTYGSDVSGDVDVHADSDGDDEVQVLNRVQATASAAGLARADPLRAPHNPANSNERFGQASDPAPSRFDIIDLSDSGAGQEVQEVIVID